MLAFKKKYKSRKQSGKLTIVTSILKYFESKRIEAKITNSEGYSEILKKYNRNINNLKLKIEELKTKLSPEICQKLKNLITDICLDISSFRKLAPEIESKFKNLSIEVYSEFEKLLKTDDFIAALKKGTSDEMIEKKLDEIINNIKTEINNTIVEKNKMIELEISEKNKALKELKVLTEESALK
ncbi:MAG: hypothetical protein RsTaC01_0936 [Candidatus Paraimprobicoccus trichonymphae]|uniref:Uncharacterized protein n=1 Tax=Candidatus Paraimprobicoccus trichonymphae TaxID=3033793 RepID=A0AA48KZL1_9FIRM|nr:MAG: hypothetical protein RsTaC01_0936 [Candidatus Paraimprobicoccus trichonymphae]